MDTTRPLGSDLDFLYTTPESENQALSDESSKKKIQKNLADTIDTSFAASYRISVFAINSLFIEINDTQKMYFNLHEGWHATNSWSIEKSKKSNKTICTGP